MIDASSFIVSSGRLDMQKYFTGNLEIKSGAVFSPGNSVGTLEQIGNFTLDSGATLLMEIEGPTVADSDQLFITDGSLNLSEGSSIVLDFVNGMSPNTEFAVIINASNSEAISQDLLNFVDSYYFTNLSYAPNGGYWVLSGKVDANAVPEPSTWALLALGVVVLFLHKRK